MSHTTPRSEQRTPVGIAARRSLSTESERLLELDIQHESLSRVIEDLVVQVRRCTVSDDGAGADLQRLIDEAQGLLAAHFAFEEAGGHLGDATAVAPRLSNRAASLRRDHRRLSDRFSKLAATSLTTDTARKRLMTSFEDFFEDLKTHELEENRLIQEAFLDDLGGG